MKENNTYVSGGIGFTGLLQIVFIVLKLCKVIDWSWWLVFIPAFVQLGIFVLGIIIVVVAVIINTALENKRHRERMKRILGEDCKRMQDEIDKHDRHQFD